MDDAERWQARVAMSVTGNPLTRLTFFANRYTQFITRTADALGLDTFDLETCAEAEAKVLNRIAELRAR
jgi:hypothetical protein